MKIGGLQKFSLIDYPGQLSAIIFTQGCNMRCSYCHNPELVDASFFGEEIADQEVLSFLKKRVDQLGGVVVTGGEPTIQPDLVSFLEKIKKMGFMVKLDTNGSCPDVLMELISKKLIDYYAMDIKAPMKNYSLISGSEVDADKIQESIALIMGSFQPHEFRTTIVSGQLGREDIFLIAELIKGADHYVLQNFKSAGKILDHRKITCRSYEHAELLNWAKDLEKEHVKKCSVR
jgi:pyruvate formate lyase activating enzyme